MQSLGRIVLSTPVIGWMIADAISGLPDAKYYFAANMALFVVALVYLFGYPALITFALFGTFSGLALIVFLTALDAFPQLKAKIWGA